eukprot:170669-Rhodomonas_salina.4
MCEVHAAIKANTRIPGANRTGSVTFCGRCRAVGVLCCVCVVAQQSHAAKQGCLPATFFPPETHSVLHAELRATGLAHVGARGSRRITPRRRRKRR